MAWKEAEDVVHDVRLIGDLCIAAYFGAEKDKDREALRRSYRAKIDAWKAGEDRSEIDGIAAELRGGLGLALESHLGLGGLRELALDELHGAVHVEAQVVGLPHGAHAPATDRTFDLPASTKDRSFERLGSDSVNYTESSKSSGALNETRLAFAFAPFQCAREPDPNRRIEDEPAEG